MGSTSTTHHHVRLPPLSSISQWFPWSQRGPDPPLTHNIALGTGALPLLPFLGVRWNVSGCIDASKMRSPKPTTTFHTATTTTNWREGCDSEPPTATSPTTKNHSWESRSDARPLFTENTRVTTSTSVLTPFWWRFCKNKVPTEKPLSFFFFIFSKTGKKKKHKIIYFFFCFPPCCCDRGQKSSICGQSFEVHWFWEDETLRSDDYWFRNLYCWPWGRRP